MGFDAHICNIWFGTVRLRIRLHDLVLQGFCRMPGEGRKKPLSGGLFSNVEVPQGKRCVLLGVGLSGSPASTVMSIGSAQKSFN